MSYDDVIEAREIMRDPMASAAAITRMARQFPVWALNHPNCPKELWERLAVDHPIEAMQSPAGQLFFLEEPSDWLALEQKHAKGWLGKYQLVPSASDQLLLGADIAEHVLPIFEAKYPHDKNLHRAIEAIRQKATGHLTPKMETAALLAVASSEVAVRQDGAMVYDAAHVVGVVQAALQGKLEDALVGAQTSVYNSSPDPRMGARLAWEAKEILWQWRRLAWYLGDKK